MSVKAPVFSFGKIMDLDTVLGGPEMKSTGGSNRTGLHVCIGTLQGLGGGRVFTARRRSYFGHDCR